MIPGMNPRQMKQAMKRMGMQQEEIDAVKVIIETADKRIVFDAPQVAKVNMMGQESFQIVGSPQEEALDSTPDINEEDIATIVEQTNATPEQAKEALLATKGDLAQAIMDLSEE